MNTQQIEELELNIDQAKDLVNRGQAVNRLLENKDFNAIIRQGYFHDEAVRLVHLKSSPAMRTEEKQTAILKEMDGIGSLLGYLQKLQHQAELAQQAIEESEDTLAEIRSEGGAA